MGRGYHPAPAYKQVARWWTCQHCGKRTYEKRGEARAAAKRAHPDRRMATYLCLSGSGYHMGHTSPGCRDYHRGLAA